MVATNRSDDDSLRSPVRLDYLRRRKVLRLWTSQPTDAPIEVPRAELLEALGEDLDGAAFPPRYLLIAGIPARSDRGGDVRPLVTAFEHEDQARSAFRSLRLRSHPRTAWAQVVSLDARGQPHPICWFGTSAADVPGSVADPVADSGRREARLYEAKPAVRRWRTWPRRRSAGVGSAR